jgi:RsiW-degrading membrane proteinase PrsW (M82 family)
VLFVAALPRVADGDWTRLRISAGHQLWPVVWILVLGYAARARSVIDTTAGVFGGFFTAIWLSSVLGDWTADSLGANDPRQLIVAVPIIEEVTKLIPVVIVALIWRWRRTGSPGITDMMALGTAAGAGFAFHEDALWQRLSGSGLDGDLGFLVPSTFSDAGTAAGHAVWTGFVGLGIGLWLVNPRRWWTIAAPLAALVLVIVDHGTWNNIEEREQWNGVLLDGRLVIYLFLAGALAAIFWETVLVHRISGGTSTLVARKTAKMLRYSSGPRDFVRRWRLSHRMLRGLALRSHNLASLRRGLSRHSHASAASPHEATR